MTHSHQLTDVAAIRQFISAGRAKFTLVSKKTGQRFTFKVRQKVDEDTGSKSPFFVSVLNGPDNWENYLYIGFIPQEVLGQDWFKLVAGKKGRPEAPSFKALDWAIRHLKRGSVPEQLEFWHEGACAACGRSLTVPASIATGFGPHCADKLGIPMAEVEPKIRGEKADVVVLDEYSELNDELSF